MRENALTVAARDIRYKILDTLQRATQLLHDLDAVERADSDGSTPEHGELVNRVLRAADALGGQSDAKAITELRAVRVRLTEENARTEQLRKTVDSGGWLNAGVRNGEWKRYQSAASVEIKALSTAIEQLQSAPKAAGSPEHGASPAPATATMNGRLYLRVGRLILSLREAVVAALDSTSHSDRWAAVDAVLERTTMAVSEAGLSLGVRLQFWFSHSAELAAARKEATYQKEAATVLRAIQEGLTQRDHKVLHKLVNRARKLGMAEDDRLNTTVRQRSVWNQVGF
jgi:hypothetical protein